MAHITEFAIGGLAGRKSVYRKKLDRNLNVFFGLNGSGKTSLFKILHSAMRNETRTLIDVPFDWAEVTIHSLDYNTDIKKTIEKKSKSISKAKKKTRILSDTVIRTSFHYSPDSDILIEEEYDLRWKSENVPDESVNRWRHRYLPAWRPISAEEPEDLRYFPESRIREYDWDKIISNIIERQWMDYSSRILSDIRQIQENGLVKILKGLMAKVPQRRKAKILDSETAYNRTSEFLARQGAAGILGSQSSFEKRYNSDSRLRMAVEDINFIEKRIEEVK